MPVREGSVSIVGGVQYQQWCVLNVNCEGCSMPTGKVGGGTLNAIKGGEVLNVKVWGSAQCQQVGVINTNEGRRSIPTRTGVPNAIVGRGSTPTRGRGCSMQKKGALNTNEGTLNTI